MSLCKPCHMSFRKLIPPFTLTGHIRPLPIGRLFIYRDVRELSFIVLGKALWEMACVNGGTGKYGLEIKTDFDDHPLPTPSPLSFQVIINESLKNTPLNAVYLRYW